jgi:trk system potassium uptake protein TrkA
MKIVICGAGQVGSHAAEVLAGGGHNITVIDTDLERLRIVEETMDVRTLHGNAAHGEVLREAGVERADLFLAATSVDEINLLAASLAKAVGSRKVVARVHQGTYFERRGLDYPAHLGIDQLICPEYATAFAIARTIRTPASLAVEHFAHGQVEMQQFAVSAEAPAVGRRLVDLDLPQGSRLAMIARNGEAFIPDGFAAVQPGDTVILVGNSDIFPQARRSFCDEKGGRRKVVVMGGTHMSVWLSRALRDRTFSVRLFETDRARAEELARDLDWVTVIQADPTDRTVFQEEHLEQADFFVGLLEHDEANIIGCVLAKSRGVTQAIAVVQRATYLDLLYDIGVDRAFSPRMVAANEIMNILDDAAVRQLATLAEGIVDVHRVRVGSGADLLGKRLRTVKMTPNWVIAAIQRGEHVHVPSADDAIQAGDTVLVIGRHGTEGRLRKLFDAG